VTRARVAGVLLLMPAVGEGSEQVGEAEGLPPIRVGAWAAWAAADTSARFDDEDTGHPCRMPDGRIGRVAAVLVDGKRTLVCTTP
jgi:hypothetical protein